MTTPVVLRASLARSISYLDFEGLIPASRNIYLRFKGLPEAVPGVYRGVQHWNHAIPMVFILGHQPLETQLDV